ncbi:MAG: hypothetical protein K0S04_339 [Herbinix sp.]|jgi:hypothetical protein|nr:hypothetical protein [Herbinix sp.]
MINTSNEYKQYIGGDDRKLYANAEITLADGTILELDNSKIMGLKIDDATSQSGTFTIGAAIINKHTLIINNIYDEFSKYDFTGAVIKPSTGLQLSSSIEPIPKGVFTADDPRVKSSIITLTALDNMNKFDTPFSDIVQTFPCTAQDLLDTICTHCGVILATLTFDNYSYVINERPEDGATTCRDIIVWIAQISGNYARCNTSGALELKWYDYEPFESESNANGGYFDSDTPYSSGDDVNGGTFAFNDGDYLDGGNFELQNRYHHIYSLTNNLSLSTDDVVITGIQVSDSTEEANTVLFGETGYVISIKGNKLIQSQSDANAVANFVGAKIVGMRFRPCSFSSVSDPSREAGDVAYLTDRKQNTYQILLSSVSFSIGQSDKITCDAESASRNSSTRYSDDAKVIIEARKNTEKQLTSYDIAVQQLTSLIAGGYGLFKSEADDGSGGKIYYMHDKPTMEESTVRWFTTSEGMLEQNKVLGVWVTVSGTDKQGNALYNTLTARKISADIVRTGKIYSDDGATLIDMAFGVANTDNISFTDNIQNGFPLTMPFNIDDTVSKITKVLLKFTQQKFRTYSTTASSGGGSTTTASSGGGSTTTSSSEAVGISVLSVPINIGGTTSGASSTTMSHSHTYATTVEHSHPVNIPSHSHSVSVPSHTHGVTTPDHTHTLNFGVQETDITNNVIDIYVDGFLAAVSTDLQGVIDLTSYVTTVGWHTIEIRTAVLKRVSAQINIKSYIRS